MALRIPYFLKKKKKKKVKILLHLSLEHPQSIQFHVLAGGPCPGKENTEKISRELSCHSSVFKVSVYLSTSYDF